MTNNPLTPDRIEAARAGHEKRIKKWETAITERQEEIEKYPWKGIPTFPDVDDWRESEIVRRRRQIDDAETAIVALDLAERFRWRSIAELREEMKNIDPLKQLEDKTPVLAQSVAWGKCVITTKGRLIDVPYEYSAWMPLPEWEGGA